MGWGEIGKAIGTARVREAHLGMPMGMGDGLTQVWLGKFQARIEAITKPQESLVPGND